jgi:hypothetical protein
MKRYLIQRDLPEISKVSATDLRATIKKSNDALAELAPDIQWVESYFTDDHSYCIYLAKDVDIIFEHGRRSGIPVTKVSQVHRIVTPVGA